MTQVSKITSNKELTLPMVGGAVPALSLSDKEVLAAFSSKKIGELEKYTIGDKLNDAITLAYFHLGYTLPDEGELIALQVYLAEFLKSEPRYQNIHVDEISVAIKRGADNQYGEFFGINPATITGWIKAHVESESRKAAKLMEQQIKLSQNVKPEPTEEQIREDFIQRLEMLYIFHQTGKEILKTEGSFYFEKLYSSKVIRLTEDQRTKLKQKAYDLLTKAKNPAIAKTKGDHEKMKVEYDSFLKAGIEGNDVKREAMYLGLIQWFTELAEFDMQIRDHII